LQPAENNEPKEREKPEEIRSKKGGKNRDFACVFFFFVGDVTPHCQCRREEETESSRIHQLFGVVCGGAWSKRAAIVLQLQEKAFPAIPEVLEAVFVIFKVFNVIFF